ncbi:hypothetical protein CROQUDRAFT_62010 [Cronartium quercuum f. sp. fusiforme G11]|uniref:DUF3533 domain-containing protein n=1 Tax=Cronartium quercuum f. sp. fusiforme G11 TaxID=708437 RepID=A0A9P6NJI1_9BASI|nr:hypothetical protein CROQUDRAFT_62010 [Cronartium quercuum f. sp. fusiforme G11]
MHSYVKAQTNPLKSQSDEGSPHIAHASVPGCNNLIHYSFLDPAISSERKRFMKKIIFGLILTSVIAWGCYCTYWYALSTSVKNSRQLRGALVDFDRGFIGEAVISAFRAGIDQMDWLVVEPSLYNSSEAVGDAILAQDYWAGIVVNRGASDNLIRAIETRDSSYNGSSAVTAYVTQARHDKVYSGFIIPSFIQGMQNAQSTFAKAHAQLLADTVDIESVLGTAPQTITSPLGYVLNDMRPFDVPAATAVTFVGLVYLLIIAYLMTMANLHARMTSGLYHKLNLHSLLVLRVLTPFFIYFCLAWVYVFISLAFRIPFGRYYEHSGIWLYWLMSFAAMSALGFGVEAFVTLIPPPYTLLFFLITLTAQISVLVFPFELLPPVFRYGYVSPFYCAFQTTESIIFNVKSQIGLDFSVQIGWIVMMVAALCLFQIYMHKK